MNAFIDAFEAMLEDASSEDMVAICHLGEVVRSLREQSPITPDAFAKIVADSPALSASRVSSLCTLYFHAKGDTMQNSILVSLECAAWESARAMKFKIAQCARLAADCSDKAKAHIAEARLGVSSTQPRIQMITQSQD